MKIDIAKLRSLSSYAKMCGVSRQAILEREKNARIELITIDGMRFIDTAKYPVIPKMKQSGKPRQPAQQEQGR